MASDFFRRLAHVLTFLACGITPLAAQSDPAHGIAMYGSPALPPDFVSLPYVNPEAPKGGKVVTGNVGGFDSLNPFIIRGTPPWQLRYMAYESLMLRSQDEPFTIYGLLAESPYMVTDYEVDRHVVLTRNPDYWGRDLPIRRGTNNFDEIRIEFYGDDAIMKEAFKAGAISYVREFNAEQWERQYDFPAVQRGDIVKSEIPHQKPSGITGFVMNMRNPPLDDWRVREALILAFNFEFINETLTGGRQPRITSYFSGSVLGMRDGPAPDAVAALLEPYRDTLLPGALDGYSLPVSDGTKRNRSNIRRAAKLLDAAGWTVQDGIRRNAEGRPLELSVLLKQDGE